MTSPQVKSASPATNAANGGGAKPHASPCDPSASHAATCIPAKTSRPPAQPGMPAPSSTYMVLQKSWPWQPGHPAPCSILAAWIYQALASCLDSTMHVLASLSSRHGLRASKLVTATCLMGSPIPMCPDIVPMQTRPSWDTLPSNTRI